MTFPTATWEVIESRVDYWSGTTDSREIGEWAYERARDYVESDRLGDVVGSGANIQGYVGIASDHTFTGEREGSVFVRFSSLDASGRWVDFQRAGLRCSRIDVCVTCTAGRDVPDVAYSIRYGPRLPSSKRIKRVPATLYSSETSGDTCYLGSAGSARRGRIYDKGRESPEAYSLGAWRWEVQLRHKFGDHVANALASRERVAPWIATYTRDYFLDRGIHAPWTPQEAATLPILRAEDSSDVKRMKWLKTSIRPMVQKLKARYSIHELREALGLLYGTDNRPRPDDPKRDHPKR